MTRSCKVKFMDYPYFDWTSNQFGLVIMTPEHCQEKNLLCVKKAVLPLSGIIENY